MKLKIFRYIGLLVLAALSGFILVKHQDPILIQSTQVSVYPRPLVAKKIVKGVMTIQEITTTKEFINGVAIRFKTFKRKNTNENILLLTDSALTVLYRKKFASGDVKNEKYREFNFGKSLRSGKGHRLYICLFSSNGDTANSIAPLINPEFKLGPCYISVLLNENPVNSIQNKALGYPGGMLFKVYESDTARNGWLIKIFWLIIIILAACLFIFFERLMSFLIRINLKPEIAYLCLAVPFGLILVILTPPFQVPDELVHFCRAYEISALHPAASDKKVPSSIFQLESVFSRLKFNPDEKTSRREIDSLSVIKPDPASQSPSSGPDYIIPYIPQSSGVALGRMLNFSTLNILYLGRLINLLFSVSLIFLAIRKIPFFKWVIFLLALMPKTEFQLASLSYDAVTIGLSFLLISLFLHYSFSVQKIRLKNLGLLLGLTILLALCKPPYFLIGLLFLMLPAAKVGRWPRYIILASAIVLPVLYLLFAQQTTSNLFRDAGKLASEEAVRVSDATQSAVNQVIDPAGQLNYISHNLSTYMGLVARTNFVDMRSNIFNNFVSALGWLDTYIPQFMVVITLLLLLFTSLFDSAPTYRAGCKNKILFFIVFMAGLLAIETSMYLYTTYVGLDRMFGIQGRYFIPLAPLFFLLFQNNLLQSKLNLLVDHWVSGMSNPGKIRDAGYTENSGLFTKTWSWLLILFSITCLFTMLAVVYLRYYVR